MRLCVKCGVQPVFGTCKVTGNGYCKSHQYLRQDKSKETPLQKAINKAKNNPQSVTKELRFPIKNRPGTFDESVVGKEIIIHTVIDNCIIKGSLVDMDSFWNYAASVIAKGGSKCWECGDIISKADYRNSTGHIFPKSLFLSVASNPWNFVVVGCRCGCHHKTHTLATFSQMSIFPTAVNRYTKFGHLITEQHKYLDLFLDYANQIM